jgi:DNA-binding transcriptional ArsR family regulator
MIRLHVPANAVERLAFTYSPLVEAVLSLHVLTNPEHHPLQHAWVRKMRRLPAALKREIAALAFLYDGYIPGPLALPVGSFLPFDGELAQIRAVADEQTLRFELTRSLYGGAVPRDPALLEQAPVREEILARANDRDAKTGRLAILALDSSVTLFTRVCDLLAEYWETAFREEWAAIEEKLTASVAEAGRTLAAGGVYGFLEQLRPGIGVDSGDETFWRDSGHEHEVEIDADTRLLLVPSIYVWPHTRINCDPPWALALVFPAPFVRRQARPPLPPGELLAGLRALNDATRLRALRLMAERPRSGQELAPLIGLSQSGLSRGLHLLHDAGLVTARRDGKYVLYSLDRDRLAAFTEGLHHFFDHG